MFKKNLKSRLEKLVVLVNRVDEKNYNIHSVEFHNWLAESYIDRDEEIFEDYNFIDWLDFLINMYEFLV